MKGEAKVGAVGDERRGFRRGIINPMAVLDPRMLTPSSGKIW
jgi:hypothetical protein